MPSIRPQAEVVMSFLFRALARIGLARAYALQGNTARARAAYQDFLAIRKDADHDIPILKEAKAEYARLRKSPRSVPSLQDLLRRMNYPQ